MSTRFARTSRGPFGQYDSKVDGFKFYGEAIRRLRSKAASAPGGAIDLSEYIRRVLLVDAFGVDHMASVHRRQYEAVAVKGGESAGGE